MTEDLKITDLSINELIEKFTLDCYTLEITISFDPRTKESANFIAKYTAIKDETTESTN